MIEDTFEFEGRREMAYHLVLPFVIAIINDEEGRVLLGRHPNLPRKPYPGLWDMPGGKMEPLESPAECVAREVEEETGLTVIFATLVGVFHHSGRNIRSLLPNCLPGLCICYQVVAGGGRLVPDELEDLHWVSVGDLAELIGRRQMTPWAEHFLQDLLE